MPIVSEKKFLTKEELDQLRSIQKQTQEVIFELGEIELIKLQLENRYNKAKTVFEHAVNLEKEFSTQINNTYGKIELNPETGEITKLG
jgi:hypothetical protein